MPEKQFLYQELDVLSRYGGLNKDIPYVITQNLNPLLPLRPYQEEAFARFFKCHKSDYPGKTYPLHLLYNMATGSGKTLIMAGLILYLYQQGYRNFLFFVNSVNIIEKTKDNFLNPSASKYLFNQTINIDNQRVNIAQVENFEAVNSQDINICFTTIQKLHSDLTTPRENAITFEDFRKHRVVLIADEAHHMNVSTKSDGELFESWENTVQKIHEQNRDNILLEFTATHDYASKTMEDKYLHKVIYRYDLREYRNDRYSKDITSVYSDFDLENRILQALILSQYKQQVAAKHRINLKPVILFKAQRTIQQSKENKANFHKLIQNLSAQQVSEIRRSTVPVIKRAFRFFAENNINDSLLAEILKREFREEYCLSVNEDSEANNYQILVNTLEDRDNRIRAIFAVQKLSEGWDVLNLFDIVRCYETRDSGKGKIGTTTMSEAQLIGRGARYFPFVLPGHQDRYRRKFDADLDNELRVIEELHYHSINDSRYISEIGTALETMGIVDAKEVTREIKLKDSFKKEELYKYGLIYTNRQVQKDHKKNNSFADFGVKKKNFSYTIATGTGGEGNLLENNKEARYISDESRKDIPLKQIERNVIQSALARNPFYYFSSLKHYFPNLISMDEFIDSESYLAGLEITFRGNIYNLGANKFEKLKAVLALLSEVEGEIRDIDSAYEYEGSREFYPDYVHQVFTDKKLKFSSDSGKLEPDPGLQNLIDSQDWFAFNSLYATSEEQAFVFMLARQIESRYKDIYEEIFLIRNEGHFSIYNFSDGRTFQPDFVLFMREKTGQRITYQLFIEPKGKHLAEHDQWKKDFLAEIKKEFGNKLLRLNYRLIGIPFYNNEDENAFRETLNSSLD
jgi:Uncharacterized protein conserved in bacteria